jgi:ubiquitin-protein ligase
MGELKILNQNRTSFVQGIQDPEDYKMFYFIMVPDDEPYKGGLYIGQIQISDEYPAKSPIFKMLTPSGRFEINKAICLTNSHYHPEHSTAAWNINSMIIAFISIFIEDDTSGISHIKDTKENRKRMAMESYNYNRERYSRIFVLFDQFVNEDFTLKSKEEINTIIEMYKPKAKKEKELSKLKEVELSKLKEEKELSKLKEQEELSKLKEQEELSKLKEEKELSKLKVEELSKLKEQQELSKLKKVEVHEVETIEPVKKVIKRVVKKKAVEETETSKLKEVETTEPVKKVIKRVVNKKAVEETETSKLKEVETTEPVKKVIKRVVKKKTDEETETKPIEPVEKETTEPVKKVIKRVVKKNTVNMVNNIEE